MPDASVSIAMCTYNAEKYVGEQLDSFVRQTRKPDELVVCDDMSSDRTVKIIEAFAKTAPFDVRLFVQPHNVGRMKNFDKAISLCAKDFIFLSDFDDVWHPEKIAAMAEALQNAPHAGGVFCNAELTNKDLTSRNCTFWDICGFAPAIRERFRQGEAFSVLFQHDAAQGASLAFRSSFRPLLLPLSAEWGHDSWISILLAAASQPIFVERVLTYWRQHETNMIGDPRLRRLSPLQKLLSKARDPRGYYRKKRDELDYAERLLNDLAARLAAQSSPDRFGQHLAIIEQRHRRLIRKRRLLTTWLAICGDFSPRPQNGSNISRTAADSTRRLT